MIARPRLALALGLLVLLPLALLVFLGARVARDERARLAATLQDLRLAALRQEADRLAAVIAARERELVALLAGLDAGAPTGPAWDETERRTPTVAQLFAQDPDGRLRRPDSDGPLSAREQAFLTRARSLFDDRVLLHAGGQAVAAAARAEATATPPAPPPAPEKVQLALSAPLPATGPAAALSFPPRTPGEGGERDRGWLGWHWDHGLHLLYWLRRPDGGLVGAELGRARLLADLIAALPDAIASPALPAGVALSLLDGDGRVLYRRGSNPPQGFVLPAEPRAALHLAPPLHSFTLRWDGGEDGVEEALGRALKIPLGAGLLALALALGGLALWLYRENTRDWREAQQRVGFVSQVSHELKTPLTNIRLHAELLEEQLPEEEARARERVAVIVGECRRLSRLIGNVLTFARQQRDQLRLDPRPAVPDEVVQETVASFAPALATRGLQVHLMLAAGRRVRLDRDALEQILGNLLTNVEKYAAAGGAVWVRIAAPPGRTVLEVRDAGPGIPPGREDFIFEPFARLHDHLSEGSAGTGIGLTIARELARRHGGELRLVYSNGPLPAVAPFLPPLAAATSATGTPEPPGGPPAPPATGAAFQAELATPDANEEERR